MAWWTNWAIYRPPPAEPASWLACLIFGSLISPTDPIAVMGTLKTLHAPPSLKAKIAGESLFNDGVAVVVFSGLVTLLVAQTGVGHDAAHGGGHGSVGAMDLLVLFVQEAGGGALLGLVFGWFAYRLMLSIDDYKVEVMITLALAVTSGEMVCERVPKPNQTGEPLRK